MTPIVLTPITKKLIIKFTQKPVRLSARRQAEIENFWEKANHSGNFHRGEVFSVDTVTEDERFFKVTLSGTDYAHYIHTVKNQITDVEGCKVIYGAGLVETMDSKLIFGEMAQHTAYPGRLQCVGGGLSNEDKSGNTFDIKQSVLRELSEELGIDSVESCTPSFLKKGGPYNFIVILFHIKLKMTSKELKTDYHMFTKNLVDKGGKPKFQNLIYLDHSKEAIMEFLKYDKRSSVDYLKPFLERLKT